MTSRDRLGVACFASMACGVAMLLPITADAQLIGWCLLAAAGATLIGVVARRFRLIAGVVHLLQLAAGLALAGLLVWGLHPTHPIGDAVAGVIGEALQWIRVSSAPMPANPAVSIMAAWAVWMLTTALDILVVTLEHPALGIGPLLIPYSIPSLTIAGAAMPASFGWFVLGTGVLLVADLLNRAAVLKANKVAGPAQRRRLLGAATMTLTLAAAAGMLAGALPGVDDSGNWGALAPHGPVQMSDPSLDMKRNLEQPADRTVLTYTTDRPNGSYLRLAALPLFDVAGWRLTPTELFGGGLPAPEGMTGGTTRNTTISIDGFSSQWLPLPYAPVSFSASGDWRHDAASLTVLWAGAGRPPTPGLSYQVVSRELTLTPDQLRSAQAGTPQDVELTTAVPDDLPDRIATLAREITADATTDGERAVALQAWLRSSRFSYSLEPAPGTGYQAIEQFLFVDRRGYCEQFAGSMAIMARTLGIPARVAVGFLPGRQVGTQYRVSIRDMHAWPELYFRGLGWVAFEPTPDVATPPAWAAPTNSPSPSPSASATPTRSSTPRPSSAAPIEPDDPTTPTPGMPTWVGSALRWAAGAIALLAVALIPWLVRSLRRRRRLATADPDARPEAAWAEVRDTVWDTGRGWPTGTLQQRASALATRLDGPAAEAVGDLANWVERGRYDRGPVDAPPLDAQVRLISEGLWNQPRLRRRWLRKLFPASIVRVLGRKR